MSTSDRFCGLGSSGLRTWDRHRASVVRAGFLVGAMLALASAPAFAAGIEHPDIGTIAIGRGGAYAAAPSDGLAMQYNPAGFASQHGWRLTLDANMSFQQLSFAPATGGATVSNSAGGFLVGAPIVSYGFGHVGWLSSLTLALGFTTPSAIGKETYPGPPATPDAAQRYALIASDYFIIYYSAAIAASYKWFSAGVTLQLVHGSAKFSQAAWSGPYMGTDTFYDAIANVDVSNTVVPTAVFGVTARPIPKLALGLSYRPRFDFIAHGTLTNDLPPVGNRAGGDGRRQLDRLLPALSRRDPLRRAVRVHCRACWSRRTSSPSSGPSSTPSRSARKDIHVTTPGTDRTLANIIFQKDFQDAISVRVGADYELLPSRLTVRAGYLHETSAIPLKSVSVDFGNWQRDAVSVGGTVKIWRGLNASVAYAHHFIADQNVTDSQVVQIVTPCSTPGCTDPAPTVVGKGIYKASLDVVSLSLGVILDDFQARPYVTSP